MVTFVYDQGTMSERRLLWDLIQHFVGSNVGEPCLLLGDFNEVLHVDQGQWPGDKLDVGSTNFNRVIEEVDLVEILTREMVIHLEQWDRWGSPLR